MKRDAPCRRPSAFLLPRPDTSSYEHLQRGALPPLRCIRAWATFTRLMRAEPYERARYPLDAQRVLRRGTAACTAVPVARIDSVLADRVLDLLYDTAAVLLGQLGAELRRFRRCTVLHLRGLSKGFRRGSG